jgi:Uma2 family endonuclease
MSIYRRVGVRHVWLVDPVGRSLEVFRADEDAWKRVGSFQGEDLARAEPFEAVELALADLWLEAPDER